MNDVFYPHDFLPTPTRRSGYGLKPVSPLIRTTMKSGRSRLRRKYISTPTIANVVWLFRKEEQAQLFEAWYRDSILDGSAWFMMRLRTPIGVDFYKCRFVDIYEGPFLVPVNSWQFTANVELWERPLVSDGWGLYPEFIIGSELIDIALNKEWPKG
jgi:hypothetical protein